VRPNTSSSPFATSTAWAYVQGASAYNQSWISVVTDPQNNTTASISGQAISMTTAQKLNQGVSQFYYLNHSDYALAGQAYYTSGQAYSASSDEAICVDNSFKILDVGYAGSFDPDVSRTHIIKVEP
jgi:hypothetical protein